MVVMQEGSPRVDTHGAKGGKKEKTEINRKRGGGEVKREKKTSSCQGLE